MATRFTVIYVVLQFFWTIMAHCGEMQEMVFNVCITGIIYEQKFELFYKVLRLVKIIAN